jgi:hypothetical protein
VAVGKNVNAAVAAYITTQARIKLYEYLRKLEEPVFYCDTDSVIYIQNVDDAPKVQTGDYLGDLTVELQEFGSGSFIKEFVSGARKTMYLWSFALLQGNVHLHVK